MVTCLAVAPEIVSDHRAPLIFFVFIFLHGNLYGNSLVSFLFLSFLAICRYIEDSLTGNNYCT